MHVRVRGQLAACSGQNELYNEGQADNHNDYCGFVYTPSATPIVTALNPTFGRQGDTIEIHGSGFSDIPSDHLIRFGSAVCEVVSSSYSQITCLLGESFAGNKQLYLHSKASGLATTDGIEFFYTLSVESINVASGSQAGGMTIVIYGAGFHPTSSISRPDSLSPEEEYYYNQASQIGDGCSTGWENMVDIGGSSCKVLESTLTTITCVTPEETGNMTTYDIGVTTGCPDNLLTSYPSAVLSGGYTYDATLTPTLDSIVPLEGAIYGGDIVLISGTGLTDDPAEVSVKVRNLLLKLLANSRKPYSYIP